MAEEQELQGRVERVVFRNTDNGWTVLELAAKDGIETVVGIIPMASVGERLTLRGEYTEHPTFGHQFKASDCKRELPEEAESILRYLQAGSVKGIGPTTAAAIVKKFGDDSLRIMEQEPERLCEVRGISPARARKIAEEFAAQFGLREVMLALGEYGLTAAEAMSCWKRFGPGTVERVRENPYLLCSSGLSIRFERIDELCLRQQLDPADPRRLCAALLYVLRHNTGNGHTCLPEDKLTETTAQLLEVSPEAVGDELARMAEAEEVRALPIGERRFVFLPELYRAERYIARRIAEMTEQHCPAYGGADDAIAILEKRSKIAYEEEQRRAIHAALEQGLLVLTGGPGTGKTTTLKAMLSLLTAAGETVVLAAPTGRAAKRMSELTGCEAKTLHRLLEVQWNENDTPVFARHERNPLDADAVIVDELSMVDVLLFESLLRAMKPGTRLILVGDSDQLPAVGPGNVLGDLIASEALTVVQLNRVFRQAMQSQIVTNAHRIVAGEYPVWSGRDGDFFLMPVHSFAAVTQTVMTLCAERLPRTYKMSVFDGIQVLCPGRRGEIGTVEFNRRLQEILNPYAATKTECQVEGRTLRVGDKVMQIRNNYDIGWMRDDGSFGTGIFNGDVGVLTAVSRREDALTVRFDDREVTYTREEAKDLELAYAVTVHKSQGSEFDIVILPLFGQQKNLCYRNLLYTAVTRAKRLLIVVGSEQTVRAMVENDRKTLRYSALGAFLREERERLS